MSALKKLCLKLPVLILLLAVLAPSDVYAQQRGNNYEEPDNERESERAEIPDIETRRNPLLEATTIGDTSPMVILRGDERGTLRDGDQQQLEEYEPGEFELYVQRVTGLEVPRYGADLLLPARRDFSLPSSAPIPPDYRVNVGDTISISLAGSVEGSVERTVDRNGEIFLPSVGSVSVQGVRQGDLRDHIARAVGTQFRNFRVGVRVSELRGIRVFVTGFATNPGSFTLSNLSTVSNAVLQAGGPTAGGSFRRVKLIRDGREIGEFDLYDLLLRGSRAHDPVLENEDVLFIPPVGRQVAVIGSVNNQAIYELRGGESISDVLALAGGPTSLGELNRAIVYRANFGETVGPTEVSGTELASVEALAADIIRVLPQGSLQQPQSRQSIVVTIEGEVNRPGNYYLPATATMTDLVAAAGGLTEQAFPFGSILERISIKAQQRQGYADALDQFELALATAPLSFDSAGDLGEQQAKLEGARATLERLREAEPDGRLVLGLSPDAAALPIGLRLENGDRVEIPAVPSSVGVFGAVYRAASFEVNRSADIGDYLDRSGGVIRGGDSRRLFVVRANGEVLPRNRGAMNAAAVPGDVVFVPVRTNSTDLFDRIAQFAAIVFQFGISAATVAAIN